MANVPWLARLLRAHANRLRGHTDGLLDGPALSIAPGRAHRLSRPRPVYVDLRFEVLRMACGIAVAHIADRNQRAAAAVAGHPTRRRCVRHWCERRSAYGTVVAAGWANRSSGNAFEPNPLLASCLERTVAGLSNARLYGVALSTRKPMRCSTFPRSHDGESGRLDARTIRKQQSAGPLPASRTRRRDRPGWSAGA